MEVGRDRGGEEPPPFDLGERTKRFGVRVVRFYTSLPKTNEARVLGMQLLRSGTSPGAQYREARRARSNAEFVSKMNAGLQELDETAYWFELLSESGVVAAERVGELHDECRQLISIFVTMINNAKGDRMPCFV